MQEQGYVKSSPVPLPNLYFDFFFLLSCSSYCFKRWGHCLINLSLFTELITNSVLKATGFLHVKGDGGRPESQDNLTSTLVSGNFHCHTTLFPIYCLKTSSLKFQQLSRHRRERYFFLLVTAFQ